MTPEVTTQSSAITTGQIDQICDCLMTALRNSNLSSRDVQFVLSEPGSAYIDEMVDILLVRASAVCKFITPSFTVSVSVNRGRTLQEALDATGRSQFINHDVLEMVPRGAGDVVEVVFFKLALGEHDKDYICDNDIEQAFKCRGLRAADLFTLAAVSEAEPSFADEYPCATHFKDNTGKRYRVIFDRCEDKNRRVFVSQNSRGYWYSTSFYFAGVRC